MRRRLLGVVMGILAVGLLALAAPLAIDLASVRTQRLFLDRLADAQRLVLAAQRAADVSGELARYDRARRIPVAVLDRAGHVQAASRTGLRIDDESRRRAAPALSGRHGEPPRVVWPWSGDPLVVAEPVLDGGDVAGAVVTLSPTDGLRGAIARVWLLLGLGELVAVLACGLLAARLLRPAAAGPAHRLDTADAAHQLRNPLQALLLRLDSLALRAPRDCEAEVDAAAREGRHLVGILERLLEPAHAGASHTPPERVDLGPLVAQRVDAWSAAAHVKGMTICRAGDAHVEALADRVAVSSALDVVLDNAVKFGPPGSTVHVAVAPEGAGAVISVRDEGQGLRRGELRRAGNRFWRGHGHRDVAGSGLGLAIARSLLEPGGGRLELRAAEPRGLEARLRLPATSNLPQIRRAPADRGRIVRGG